MEDENIKTIKIDPDGKYVLVLEYEDHYDYHLDELLKLSEEINDWYLSDDKFCVFPVNGLNVKVRFEKVGDEDNSIS